MSDTVSEQKNVFNDKLSKEVCKFIEKNNNIRNSEKLHCFVVLNDINPQGYKDKECYIYIGMSLFIDTLKITGYTFISDEFVSCYILKDSCNCSLINTKELLHNKEVYRNIFYSNYPIRKGNYHYPLNVYKVLNSDSLLLID